MQHTNVSFRPDSDSISIDDQYKPRVSDQTTGSQNINVGSSPRTTIDIDHENNISSEQKVPDMEMESKDAHDDDNSYYSLKNISQGRRGERDEDSGLSRTVKRFYKNQDELIDGYERMSNRGKGDDNDANTKEKKERQKTIRMSHILTRVSLGVNLVRVILYF